MAKKGLMIDYLLCTGCHSCEVSCKLEKNLPTGEYGIKLAEDKPWRIDEDTCKDRAADGKVPSCVLHCCSHCMHYGDLEDLAKQMSELDRKAVLFTI